jgi:hypothetical protein
MRNELGNDTRGLGSARVPHSGYQVKPPQAW